MPSRSAVRICARSTLTAANLVRSNSSQEIFAEQSCITTGLPTTSMKPSYFSASTATGTGLMMSKRVSGSTEPSITRPIIGSSI